MILSSGLSPVARGLITLYTSSLLAGMWSMIVPALPVLAKSFDISPGTAAQAITALAIGRFAGMPVSGVVLDRLGTRAALTAGPAIACGAALLAGFSPWFGLILLLVFLLGIGESIWVIAREVAGIDLVPLQQRGRVLSGFHGINNLGLALGPLIGGLLTETIAFHAVFFAYAACAALSVLLGVTVATGDAQPTKAPVSPARSTAGWGIAALGQRLRGLRELFYQIRPELRATYIVLVFATFTSFGHRVTTQSILPLFAHSSLGLSPREVGMLFTISGVSVFAMIFPAGFVIDKVGRKWATVPSTGIPAIAFLLIPFAQSFFQLAVLISFLGIANGLSLGSLATSTFDIVPASARGRLQALRRTLAETGGIGAPLFGGYLADMFSPGVPFLAYAPLLVLSALLLAVVAHETLEK
jgi:MFS family permease